MLKYIQSGNGLKWFPNLFEVCEVVFEEHLGVLDGVLGSYEDEGDVSLFPGHGGLRLVVAFDLHSHHTRLVNDFLPNVTCRCGQLSEISVVLTFLTNDHNLCTYIPGSFCPLF